MKIKDKIKISFVRNFLYELPREVSIIKIENGYLYENKYYATIDSVLNEMNKKIKKELK